MAAARSRRITGEIRGAGHNELIFALNPAGYPDPALAIAASRAGAVGVLNGEFGAAADWIEPALRRLAQFGGPAIGLKLAHPDAALLTLAEPFRGRLGYLVVDPMLLGACGSALAAFRRAGGRVVLEIADWSPEIEALCGAADALWLKGHEAGGWVGEQTSFILLQNVANRTSLPLYVRGGINERSAAAVRVGGAAGVVLDDQLLLLRESPLAPELAPKLRRFTGIETILLDQYGAGPALRIWPVPGRSEARAMAAAVREAGGRIAPQQVARVGWTPDAAAHNIPPLGQDGVVAPRWAERYGSVARALRGVTAAIAEFQSKAAALRLCGPGSPLALAHGTRYPIVQGPMTHVSDRASFIDAVASAGGLPIVAVSLLRGDKLRQLLCETKERLGDRPWGVGILGFVSAELLREQRAAVRDARPPYAIIAGGRPSQSKELEKAGIHTYLHVPSPALLTQFLEQGARHFIFEGRECGGHIGPLSSFVLWGQMADALTGCDLPDSERQKIQVLFAGGIHDASSAAMAAVMRVPLAECGIRSGILMGTAYTFTEEAVGAAAITPEFQRVGIEARHTVGLVTGPGHSSRCAVTPFVETFRQRRRELERAGVAPDAIRDELEELTLGRLRLASKGVVRKRADSPDLRPATIAEQREGGMFMIGQAAILKDRATTISALHHAVGEAAEKRLDAAARQLAPTVARRAPGPADVAIVGLSALLPGAPDLRSYWENLLAKRCAISEIPADRWDWRLYFDPDRDAPDKIYSKWGGFIPDVPFDPTQFGIPPVSVPAIDPMQLLALVAVEAALRDAGAATLEAEERERTAVILGISGGLGELGIQYATRAEFARALGALPAEALARLPQWTSESFAGLLPNVAAGRVANRLDFGGVNFTVDAACASSLAALRQGVLELETGRSDLVICGGVDTVQGPFGFTCFSKAQALSPNGTVRSFDAAADGTAISEGIAVAVLKPLADAERDGDRIYAVIKGVGGSSDGRARGLMAPLPAGQKRALQRAYAQAGYSPATVELFEAHGTGTVAGDAAEIQSLTEFLREHGAGPRQSALGSVKTMIGHTKSTAGMAGLIKVALALHHRVLPPQLGVERPNPALLPEDSPVMLNQEARPWLARPGHPRRAGVSSFGFGGTNFHVALEEYGGDYRTAARPAPRVEWPDELFLWRAGDRDAVAAAAEQTSSALAAGASPPAAGLAAALNANLAAGKATLAVVAASLAELRQRLAEALPKLRDPAQVSTLPAGVYFSDAPLARDSKLAMLFSGQGSQYPDMLRETATAFGELREALEEADAVLADTPTYRDAKRRLSQLIYPGDRFGAAAAEAARAALSATEVAQPALGAVEAGLFALAERVGLRPDMVGGHSYGEYTALYTAGVLSRRDLLRLSEARGRFIAGAARDGDLGTMAAVGGDRETVQGLLDGCDVVLANFNAPKQTVISGARAAVENAVERLRGGGLAATPIPVAAAFHSPLMLPAQAPLVDFFSSLDWGAPRIPVYANAIAAPHAAEPEAIRALLSRHLTEPVDFLGMVEAMYRAGARIFLEIGPKSVLADLTRRILGPRPHRAVSLDAAGGGLQGLLHALAALAVEGVPLDLRRLFEGRIARPVDLAELAAGGTAQVIGPNTWLVNGTRARRAGEQFAAMTAPAHRDPTSRPSQAAAKPILAPRTNGAQHVTQASDKAGPAPPNGGASPGGPGHVPGNGIDHQPAEPFEIGVPSNGADRTMAEYYQTMRQFLQVQERIMTAYLNAGEATPRPFAAPQPGAAVYPSLAAPPRTVDASTVAARAPRMPVPPAAAPAPAPAQGNGAAHPGAQSGPAASEPQSAGDPEACLLRVASERTGYPPDMLGLDLDMEADLGIDSIKRVEIIGAFVSQLPKGLGEALGARLDDLSKAKSLRGILDLAGTEKAEQRSTPRPFELAGEGQDKASAPLSRYVVRPHAEPLPAGRREVVEGGLYIVVAGPPGVTAALERRLGRDGARVRVMPDGATASEEALAKWISTVRAEDRIRGVIDLRPVQPVASEPDFAAWRRGIETQVKGLFPLLRLAANDLADGGVVLVASGMGGCFGRDALQGGEPAAFFPGAGGGVGLVKCLAFEWPNCRCKAVDLDPAEPAESLAAHLHAELAVPDGRREVGYPGGSRTIFRTEPASLIPQSVPCERPNADWVVLAIGGARGITAETLREFAALRATCVIVGRSPLPGPEDAGTVGLPDAAALRRHLLERAQASGERPTPAAVEARIAALLRDREVRANLEDFAAAGARLDYRNCDVRQEAETAALLGSLYERYGRIDAVLFGAGVIEDRLLVDKTAESLSRVVDTKVDGAFLVARHLRPESLKFVAFFTSVAGRYGNRGQTDYGAANEVLCRLAWRLQAQWGPQVKVSAINWGPWARTTRGPGMLTQETARRFRERGIRLVEPAEGRDFLIRELLYAPRADVEVIAGDHPWEYHEAAAARGPDDPAVISALPLLPQAQESAGNGKRRKIGKTIDLVSDPYLDDHRLDGFPVLPFACACEYMAEAASALGGDSVRALRDVRMLHGLVLRDARLETEFTLQPLADGAAAVEFRVTHPKRRVAYAGTAEFGAASAPAPGGFPVGPSASEPPDIAAVYRDWLFHGARFQTVRRLSLLSPERIVATTTATQPGRFFPPAEGREWLFDPGIIDAVQQLMIVWSRRHCEAVCLPTAIGRIARFGDAPLRGDFTLAIEVEAGRTDGPIRWRFEAVDGDGRTRLAGDNGESWIDAKLNRLGGGWAGGIPRTAEG